MVVPSELTENSKGVKLEKIQTISFLGLQTGRGISPKP
jgi:hypothetical protein